MLKQNQMGLMMMMVTWWRWRCWWWRWWRWRWRWWSAWYLGWADGSAGGDKDRGRTDFWPRGADINHRLPFLAWYHKPCYQTKPNQTIRYHKNHTTKPNQTKPNQTIWCHKNIGAVIKPLKVLKESHLTQISGRKSIWSFQLSPKLEANLLIGQLDWL